VLLGWRPALVSAVLASGPAFGGACCRASISLGGWEPVGRCRALGTAALSPLLNDETGYEWYIGGRLALEVVVSEFFWSGTESAS